MLAGRKNNLLIFGLERGNIDKLLERKPIARKLDDFGLFGMAATIFFEETQQELIDTLQREGIVDKNTKIDIPTQGSA